LRKKDDNFMTLRSLSISTVLAGLTISQALAQTATTPAQGTTPAPGGNARAGYKGGPGRGPGRGGPGGSIFAPNAEARITKQFGLNASQQNTLHQALASAQVQTQGMREKESTLRTQLGASVKGGDESGIERSAADIETVHQQQTSIRAKTLSTIYNSLTAAQKAKFEPMMNRELGVPGPGRGRGAGPGAPGTNQRGPRGTQQPAAAPQQ
jgi:Spy/CpxP family protein refolding chaperone